MAKYIVSIDVTRDGATHSASMEANSVAQCANIAFMVLTAQYGDANIARVDANSVEAQFKQWRNKRAQISLAGVFSLIARRVGD